MCRLNVCSWWLIDISFDKPTLAILSDDKKHALFKYVWCARGHTVDILVIYVKIVLCIVGFSSLVFCKCRICLDPKSFTVPYSDTCLSVLIGPNDVTSHGSCRGGVILKLMDECGAITARKHCQNVTVTAGIEATNFHKSIPKGSQGWIGLKRFW